MIAAGPSSDRPGWARHRRDLAVRWGVRRDVAEWLEGRLCPDVVRVGDELVPADALALLRAGVITSSVGYHHGQLVGTVAPEHLAGDRALPLREYPVRAVDRDSEPSIDTFIVFGDLAGGRAQLERAIERACATDPAEVSAWDWRVIAEACRFYTADDELAMSYLERAPVPEVADDWVRIFGDAGAARVQRAQARVLAAIEQAFDGVPFPGPTHSSLYQAEDWDTGFNSDQSRDHTGRWQDLPRDHILACQWAIFRLDAHALPYYMPALLGHLVRERHGTVLHEHVRRHLERADPARHHLFTSAQLIAVATFAAYDGMSPADCARWHALASSARA